MGKDAKADTGTGSNSNGYLTIGIGAQIALGRIKPHTETQSGTEGGRPQ